jgi:hypothetical protein
VIGVCAWEYDSTPGYDTDTQHGSWSLPLHRQIADRGTPTSSQVVSSQWKVPNATGIQQFAHTSASSRDWESIGYVIREATTKTATIAAPLGGLSASMTATVSAGSSVSAVIAAPLGGLTVAMAASVGAPVEAVIDATLGSLVVAMTAAADSEAVIEGVIDATLGDLVVELTATEIVAPTIVQAVIVASLGTLTAEMIVTLASQGARSFGTIIDLNESTGSITLIEDE